MAEPVSRTGTESAALRPILSRLTPVALASIGIPVVLVLMALTAMAATGEKAFWENAHWTVADGLAFAIVLLGARRATGLDRRVRGFFALGLGSHLVGQIAWDLQVVLGVNAFPAPSDFFTVLMCAPIALGFALSARGRVERSAEAAFYVDSTIAVAFVAFALTMIFGGRAAAGGVAGATVLAYPFGYLAAAIIGSLAMLTTRATFGRGTYLLLAGLVLDAVISVAWADASLTAFPPPGSTVGLGFSVAILIIAIGASAWTSGRSADTRHARMAQLLLATLPFGAIVAIAVIGHRGEPISIELVAVVVLAVLVLVRTGLILREYGRALEMEQATRSELVLAIDAQRSAEAQYRNEVDVFARLAERLGFAVDEQAMAAAAALVIRRLVASPAGDVLLLSASRDRLVVAESWSEGSGARERGSEIESPLSCMGIRRGAAYEVADASDDLLTKCPIHPADRGSVLCVPMLAVGEAIGVVHLENPTREGFTPAARGQASHVAEQTALAISRVRLARAMENLALSDQLTGLRNARFFDPYVDQELAAAERDGKPLGLIMADIDHFKLFNDTYGHAAGDEALRAFARAATGSLRGSDIVARYGGEEFAVLVRQVDLAGAVVAAEKMRAAVETTDVTVGPGQLARLTVSLGVASTSAHPADRLLLLRHADQALYLAKQSGRNRVVAAEPVIGRPVTIDPPPHDEPGA